jgi:hypothetical protein
MNKIFTLIFCTLLAINLKAQITKKSWLVGGNVGFSSSTTEVGQTSSTQGNVRLTGNLGYFVIDKLAIGLQPDMILSFFKDVDGDRNMGSYYSLGPFLRYYLLPVEKLTNIFIQSSYSAGIIKIADLETASDHQFSFSAGPEIFLTPSAGLQLSIGYVIRNSNDRGYSRVKILQIEAGFQFHF